MDSRIEHRAPWIPWAATAVLLTIVAIVAYVAGSYHPFGAPAADSGLRAWPYHPFQGLLTLLVFLWIIGGLRWMMWGAWGRPWRCRRGPWGHRYDDRWMEDDFAEWHRREHERMRAPRGAASSPDADERRV